MAVADICEHYLCAASKYPIHWQYNHITNIWMALDICEHYLCDASKNLGGWQHNHILNIWIAVDICEPYLCAASKYMIYIGSIITFQTFLWP